MLVSTGTKRSYLSAPTQSPPEPPITRATPARWRLLRSDWAGTGFAQFAVLLLGIVSGIASGRLLGPQGRGELAVVTLWPIAFVYIATLGLNHAVVYYAGKQRFSVSELWAATSVIGVAQSLLVVGTGFLLIPILLRNYAASLETLGLLFLLTAPAIFFSAYLPYFLLGAGDVRSFNIVRVIAPGCYAAGLVALFALRLPSVPAAVAMQAAGYIAATGAGFIYLYGRKHPGWSFRTSVAKNLLSYGVKAHCANITSYLNQRVDQLILTLLIPAEQLGLYAVAASVAISISFIPIAAGTVTFARGAAQSDIQARRTIARSFRASLLWLGITCCALFFAAPWLIQLLLGPRFAGSVVACRILLPGTIALGLNQVLYSGANAMGMPSLPSYAEGVGLAVTVVGLALLVGRYGYLGAAVVSSVAYTTSFVVMLVFSKTAMKLGFWELFLGRVHSHARSQEAI